MKRVIRLNSDTARIQSGHIDLFYIYISFLIS